MFVAARVSTGIKWAGVTGVTSGKMGAADRTGLRRISLSSATTSTFPEIPFPKEVTNPGFWPSLNF